MEVPETAFIATVASSALEESKFSMEKTPEKKLIGNDDSSSDMEDSGATKILLETVEAAVTGRDEIKRIEKYHEILSEIVG